MIERAALALAHRPHGAGSRDDADASRCRPPAMSGPRISFVPLTPELYAFLPNVDPTVARVPSPLLFTHGWAMLEGGYVLGAGGIIPIWPGRGLGWMLFAPDTRRRPIALAARFARGFIAHLLEAGIFDRIEATALAAKTMNCRYLARLGLDEPPVRLRRYGPDGADHVLYARIR